MTEMRINGDYKVTRGNEDYSSKPTQLHDDEFQKKLKETPVHVAYAQGLVPGNSPSLFGWGSSGGSENTSNAIQA